MKFLIPTVSVISQVTLISETVENCFLGSDVATSSQEKSLFRGTWSLLICSVTLEHILSDINPVSVL
jgi:hypothetical protein